MAEQRVQRRLAAILAADIVGYSRLMGEDETGTLTAFKLHRAALIDPTIAEHRGRIVKLLGDGVLVEFGSVVDAVECAVGIQEAMLERNSDIPDSKRIILRIGVNLGDIIIDDDDIYGDGVNVASRLEGLAEPGGVCISGTVFDQVKGKLDVLFEDLGPRSVKNIADPVRVYQWQSQTVAAAGATETNKALAPSDKPSIAVLPFANISGDAEQQFFADGLVEDIITTLSKLSGLRVIARNSSFVYKDKAVDVRQVAQQLGVRYVLEGSVRRSGNRLRITTQLIDATDGGHIWAERYDRSLDDIFAVQDEITLVVATEMQVKLTEGEQARLRYTTTGSVEAWTHWVQGLSHFNQDVAEDNMGAALVSWMKALALDPGSASLNAMVGFLHYLDARFSWWDDRLTAQQKAQTFADRAMELDPENADANVTSSLSMLLRGHYDEAATLARQAVRLAPGSAHAATMACFVLAFAGYASEAVPHGERALTLSPNYPGYFLGTLGNAYRLAGRTEEAISAFKAYHAKAPGFGLVDLVLIYEQNGLHEEALRNADLLRSIRQGFSIENWASTQFRADKKALQTEVAALAAVGLPMD
ncbi:MAG: adenylate/guanylate cyclase domain-containing protein [Planctomycetota bacterium]|jgi:adenylate cyclase